MRLRPALATSGGRSIALVAVACFALVAGGCGSGAQSPLATFPPASFGTGVLTAAAAATHDAVDRALRGIGLSAAAPDVAYRPAETRLFAAAPRIVLEVAQPASEVPAFISIYEFANVDAAAMAGAEQAAYVASPAGLVLFPTGTQFLVRRAGTTVLFYSWVTADEAPRAAEIATSLQAIGSEIEVAR